MSKVAIKGASTGTATFTLEAPATDTDRTLVLPDNAGTVLTSASDIEAQVKTATNASGSAPIYACRAWVNFNGTTTTPTIRASGNVSSVTKVSTGRYTINFSTAMPDTNYTYIATFSIELSGPGFYVQLEENVTNATSIGLSARNIPTGGREDIKYGNVSIFR